MAPEGTCELCGREMLPEGENLVSGLAICDRCHDGDFGDCLEKRGIFLQQVECVHRRDEQAGLLQRVEVLAALSYDLRLDATFSTESGVSRLLKFTSRELQTGDKVFDDAILIETDDQERTAAILTSPGVRAAVMDNVAESVGAYGGTGLTIEGNRCRLRDQLTHSKRDVSEMRRTLAILFHHLALVAAGEGQVMNAGCLAIPDLDSLHGPARARALISAQFAKTTFADLGPLRSLASSDRTHQVERLHLTDCHLLDGDLSPLTALVCLTELSIRNVPEVEDISPLPHLSSLVKLGLQGTAVQDIAPLAALTDLEVLNLRHTPVADARPLASLGKLQRLYLEGTSIPAEQREQLSATIPGLAIDP